MLNIEIDQAGKILKETLMNGGYTHEKNGNYIVGEFGIKFDLKGDLISFHRVLNTFLSELNVDNFGTWVEGGYIYIDKITCFNHLGNAITHGKKHGQKAIFDCLNNKSVYIDRGTLTDMYN